MAFVFPLLFRTPRLAPVRWLVLAIALPMLGWSGTAQAQGFFAESDALRPDSAVEFTFSDLTDQSDTDTGGTATFTDVESALHRFDGRLRWSVVALGAMAESRRFEETTEADRRQDDRDLSAAYGALVLEGLLADEDALYLVLSSGSREETFSYDDLTSLYTRRLETDVGLQVGLVYRIGFLIAGYISGEQTLRLEVADPLPTAIDETYTLDYTAWIAGLAFGDPQAPGLLLLVQRKDTPAVPGMQVDLAEGREELRRAEIGLGPFRIGYSQTYIREAFIGESSRETIERDSSIGFQLSGGFFVSASQRRTEDRQAFQLLGVPILDTGEVTEHLLRISFRF